MQKLVIANRGSKEQGKTSSIREVFNILDAKYPTNVYIDYGDIMATIQIGDVLVGLESQGDPGWAVMSLCALVGHMETRRMLYMRWLMMAIKLYLQ